MARLGSTSAESAARFRAALERRLAAQQWRRLSPEELARRDAETAERRARAAARREERVRRAAEARASLPFLLWLRTPAGRRFKRFARNLAAAAACAVTERPDWRRVYGLIDPRRCAEVESAHESENIVRGETQRPPDHPPG